MKFPRSIVSILAVTFVALGLAGCNKEETSTDYADAVAGTYTGKLTVGTTVVEDAYVVYVNRISSTVVSVTADFLPDEDGNTVNYNVVYENGQYLFRSETSVNISITVTGKSMTINYLSVGGNIMTFLGSRD